MPLWKQALFARLQSPENGGEGDGGGGTGGGGAAGEGGEGGSGAEGGAGAGEGEGGQPSGEKKPSDAEAKLLKEVMQKKDKLDKATAELTDLKSKLSKLEELGGLDAIAALVAEKKTAEEKQMEAKGEWDRLKARMAEENAKVVKEKEEKLTASQQTIQQLQAQINELTIGTSFSQSKFIGEDLVLTPTKARVVYGDHFDLVDGKIVGYDKPRGKGERTAIVDGSGNPVAFDEALRRIVESDPDKDQMLRSKMKPGAGSDSRRGEPTRKQQAPMTGLERIAAGLAKQGK